MMFKLCATCRFVNYPQATHCEDCGHELPDGDAGSARPPGLAALRAGLEFRDPLEPDRPAGPMRASPAAGGESPPDPAAHAASLAARAAQRAAVRRARLRAGAAAAGDFVPEVLVLDRDAPARDTLCSLLRLFGFGVIGIADTRRAAALLAERPFAAVFADIALDGADGGAGIEFCRSRHETAVPRVLVLVSAPLNAVDRVRAHLLGFDGILSKPAQRGAVARVLDASGVALPLDERRS